MYVATLPNRSSPPAVLLHESWREGGKIEWISALRAPAIAKLVEEDALC